jgi:hypothetical protein
MYLFIGAIAIEANVREQWDSIKKQFNQNSWSAKLLIAALIVEMSPNNSYIISSIPKIDCFSQIFLNGRRGAGVYLRDWREC